MQPGSAMLEPALRRPNLTLLTGTSVWRLRVSSGRVTSADAEGPSGPVTLSAERISIVRGRNRDRADPDAVGHRG